MSDTDETPGITENETPAKGLAPLHTVDDLRKVKEDATRKVLAYSILAVLGLLYLGMLAAVIFGALSADDLVRVAGALSGFQTLAAAVAGFYFARGK